MDEFWFESVPLDVWASVLDWIDVGDARNVRETCRTFRDLLERRRRFSKKRYFRNAWLRACETGDLERVQFLHDRHPGWTCAKWCAYHGACRAELEPICAFQLWKRSECLGTGVDSAAEAGNLKLLQWLRSNRTEGATPRAISLAALKGRVRTVAWLFANFPKVNWKSNDSQFENLDSCGPDVLDWFHENLASHWNFQVLAERAASQGRVDLLRWFLKRRPEGLTKEVAAKAAQYGQAQALDWIFVHTHLKPSKRILRQVDCPRCLEVCAKFAPDLFEPERLNAIFGDVRTRDAGSHEWLIRRGLEVSIRRFESSLDVAPLELVRLMVNRLRARGIPISVKLDSLASCGNLPVLRWLHEEGLIDGDENGIDLAAANGRLEVVRWLHEHRPGDGCTASAMDEAAGNGHLEIVQFLHRHRSEGCSPDAFRLALLGGHLDVASWLLKRASFPFSERDWTEMNGLVAETGRLDVLRWMVEQQAPNKAKFPLHSLRLAAAGGHVRLVRFVFENYQVNFCGEGLVLYHWKSISLEDVRWLSERGGWKCSQESLFESVKSGNFDVVKYLWKRLGPACKARCGPVCVFVAAAWGHAQLALWLLHRGDSHTRSEAISYDINH